MGVVQRSAILLNRGVLVTSSLLLLSCWLLLKFKKISLQTSCWGLGADDGGIVINYLDYSFQSSFFGGHHYKQARDSTINIVGTFVDIIGNAFDNQRPK